MKPALQGVLFFHRSSRPNLNLEKIGTCKWRLAFLPSIQLGVSGPPALLGSKSIQPDVNMVELQRVCKTEL